MAALADPEQGRAGLAWVRLRVRDDRGAPVAGARLRSSDCPTALRADDQGRATGLVPEGPCHFQGARADGLLFARSPWVAVDVHAGAENEVEIVIPSERTGGLGVALGVVEGGFAATRIHPGLPADQAGMAVGDVITAVEGEPTADMNLEQVVARMSGPEGSPLRLTLQQQGDTGLVEREITVTRAFLPAALAEAAP